MEIPVTIVTAVLLLLAMKPAHHVHGDSEHFTYNGFRGSNMTLDGMVKTESNGLLRLTNNSRWQTGHAFYYNPIEFKNSLQGNVFSFSTTFVFAIVPEYGDLAGHGFAFAISASKELIGASPSQYLGLFNGTNDGNLSNHVFAVELDTNNNVEFEDIDNNHVGIDINSLRSMEAAHAAYFSTVTKSMQNLSLASGELIQVWIEYDGVEKMINVTLSPYKISKPEKPLLNYHFDLSPIFLNSMYVGFSSATGSVPATHYILGWSFKLNGLAESFDHLRLPSLPRTGSRGMSKSFTVGISIAALVFILTAISSTIYVRRKKKYAEIFEDWEAEYGPHRFSYKELFHATKGFRDEEILGRGGFGKVYRGVLPTSKIEVAVKRVSHDSRQGLREFIAEIASLGRLRHRNLVQLLGYCRRKGELLVYDFMSNGSLDKFIFEQHNSYLNWAQRFRILRGVASGLLYLHEEWEQIVVHRDVKASNVLLDADLNGRLGDFGLARLYDHGANPQTTHVVGTLGYLAPELTRTGKATTRSDVFAFGALLLEVACGRKPIELTAASIEEHILVDWVYDYLKKGSILESIDPKLGDQYVVEEMELVLKLGLICSHPMPASRPSMRQVKQFLDGDAPLPEISQEVLNGTGFANTRDGAFEDLTNSYPASSEKASTTTDSLRGTEFILSGGR